MEEALVESEERRRLAVEAADIGVWEWDLQTQQLRWEANMFKIYGLEPLVEGMIPYDTWANAVLPADLPEQEAQLGQVIATGGRGRREFRITRATDGKVRTIQASEMAANGHDGKAKRVVGINIDVTDRKEAEGEIQKLNDDLSRRAVELERANKELEAFSYSVSHDLRAPLRAIDGFSRMLAEDCTELLTAEDQRKLEIIRSEAQRMGKLIDDLLMFSRLGRQNLEASEVDMQALAKEVFDELMNSEPERKVHLDLRSLPKAIGTQSMIRQVWTNLISNGIKFTKHREVGEIEIGALENAKEGWVYYVKDNGAGFDKRYADKLFGVFQRLHSQQEFQGTGVGLALAQRIVQRHGGRIWAEAEVDHGATFYFTLPNSK
jgi:PAS domain S-box-containing protein